MSDSTDFFGNVVKGAALGSALGPVGAGAGAAAAVVAEISDRVGLTRWLFGDKAAETRAAVAQAVEMATGASEAVAQAAALERDPAAAARLREALAGIAAAREAEHEAAQLAAFRAQLADVASAREQTMTLLHSGSVLAWGAPLVSALVLVGYGLVTTLAVWLVASRALPDGAIAVVTSAVGSLTTLASAVVAYWLGSSAGSARKSDQIERLSATAPTPPPT